jgi:hypothetical protein
MELQGHLTPVFGTAQPPRGPSGVLRRAAYRIPEHRALHWLLLVVADRVDVAQHGFRSLLALRSLPPFNHNTAAPSR